MLITTPLADTRERTSRSAQGLQIGARPGTTLRLAEDIRPFMAFWHALDQQHLA